MKTHFEIFYFVSANSESIEIEKVLRIPWKQNKTKNHLQPLEQVLQFRQIRALKAWGESREEMENSVEIP